MGYIFDSVVVTINDIDPIAFENAQRVLDICESIAKDVEGRHIKSIVDFVGITFIESHEYRTYSRLRTSAMELLSIRRLKEAKFTSFQWLEIDNFISGKVVDRANEFKNKLPIGF